MAYNKVVAFSVLLVLSMLAAATNSMAAAAAARYGAVANTPGEWCWAGMGFPVYPFPRCRALVKSQCLGAQAAQSSVREDCCRQLAAIPDDFCKCPALGAMRDSMYKELGVVMKGEGVGDGTVEAAEIFPGCRTEVMDRAIASIPAFCNQGIPIGTDGVCYWLSYYQHPKQVTSA